jgi:hypothetical protein
LPPADGRDSAVEKTTMIFPVFLGKNVDFAVATL